MRADGEHRRAILIEIDGFGDEAARSPDIGRRAIDHGHDGIVRPHKDRAVMCDDHVGDAGQILQRLGIRDDQWLAASVGARGDKSYRLELIQPGGAFWLSGQGVEQFMVMHRRW